MLFLEELVIGTTSALDERLNILQVQCTSVLCREDVMFVECIW